MNTQQYNDIVQRVNDAFQKLCKEKQAEYKGAEWGLFNLMLTLRAILPSGLGSRDNRQLAEALAILVKTTGIDHERAKIISRDVRETHAVLESGKDEVEVAYQQWAAENPADEEELCPECAAEVLSILLGRSVEETHEMLINPEKMSMKIAGTEVPVVVIG